MIEWEYRKINLNELPRKTDEVDVLCDAGEEGWELVTLLPNNVAYFKRELEEMVSEPIARDSGAQPDTNGAQPARGHEVKPKYRDPKTNETWSGRGRMASWLKAKQDAGENIDNYLV